MKTLIFQHGPGEKMGALREWLVQARFPFYVHHLYKNEEMPEIEKFDWLIVLGGPMNVNDEAEHPWLVKEKAFIRTWLSAQKPLLGICLGGQLLAQALGGEVTKNPQREIGFHPITSTGIEHPAFRRWPDILSVFQWHQDRFSLPPGCQSLFSSEACEHQAFSRDHRTIGLQFHPEAVAEWIYFHFQSYEPRPGEKFVQSKEECMHILPKLLPMMTKQFFQFLEDFTQNARATS